MLAVDEQAQQFAEEFKEKYKFPEGAESALKTYYNGAHKLLSGMLKGEVALAVFDEMSGAVESLQRHMPEANCAAIRGLLEGSAVKVFNANVSHATSVRSR